jgi:hypothetical protein
MYGNSDRRCRTDPYIPHIETVLGVRQGRGWCGSARLPACIPTLPDIAIDYICAWQGVFGRGWRVFRLDFDYICALVSRAKQAVAGGAQSRSGLLRQKMITFDYIVIIFLPR